MRTYKQLTREQRYQIYALKKAGHKQMEIAHMLGVHKSTVSWELRRNRGQRGYRPKQAHEFSVQPRQRGQVRIGAATWKLVEAKLREDWSPEQVSGWIRRNEYEQVSHPVMNALGHDEWVYQ